MSDEVNIDCTDSKTTALPFTTETVSSQFLTVLHNTILELRAKNHALNHMVADLRRELEELHARHRPKEDQ